MMRLKDGLHVIVVKMTYCIDYSKCVGYFWCEIQIHYTKHF